MKIELPEFLQREIDLNKEIGQLSKEHSKWKTECMAEYKEFLKFAQANINKTGIEKSESGAEAVFTENFGPIIITPEKQQNKSKKVKGMQSFHFEGLAPDSENLMKYMNAMISILALSESTKDLRTTTPKIQIFINGYQIDPSTKEIEHLSQAHDNSHPILDYINKQRDLASQKTQENQDQPQ